MALKIAVVGLSPSQSEAPWGDPEWKKYGLPWGQYWARLDKAFEMHDMRLLSSRFSRRQGDYFARLRECPRLYMQEAYTGLPAVPYPFDAVAESIGAYYFNSSIAYAMALAIHEGATDIALFGVDMKGEDEYGYQRPNMEYLIGVARGKGIRVSVRDDSPLCKFQGDGIGFYEHKPTYHKRYGWLG